MNETPIYDALCLDLLDNSLTIDDPDIWDWFA